MLKIKDKPQTKAASAVTFEQTPTLQKTGVEMLIALNTTSREVITGPDVGLDAKILVTKDKPHFFFNPTFSMPENLVEKGDESIIVIQFQNYLGNERSLEIKDETKIIRNAIDYLNNGKQRKTRAKKDAD